MHCIYYATSQLELIYHVATLMPTIEGDDQQISKKRHVGNDHVNIIWSENSHNYRNYTVPSQYNSVHIIIYPLKNNLFRVQIFKKDQKLIAFPWIDNAVLDQKTLVPMVRLMALNAHRSK